MHAFRCGDWCLIYAPNTTVACLRDFRYLVHVNRGSDNRYRRVYLGIGSVLDCVQPISAIQLAKPHCRPLRLVFLAGSYFGPCSSVPLGQQIAETASPHSRRRRLVPIAIDISVNSSTAEAMNPS